MATQKQKALAKKIVENNGNVSKSMRDVGYSESSATNPQVFVKALDRQGLIDKHLPDSLIMEALEEDIKAKKQNRKGEIELAAKIKRMLSDKQEVDLSGTISIEWGDDSDS